MSNSIGPRCFDEDLLGAQAMSEARASTGADVAQFRILLKHCWQLASGCDLSGWRKTLTPQQRRHFERLLAAHRRSTKFLFVVVVRARDGANPVLGSL